MEISGCKWRRRPLKTKETELKTEIPEPEIKPTHANN